MPVTNLIALCSADSFLYFSLSLGCLACNLSSSSIVVVYKYDIIAVLLLEEAKVNFALGENRGNKHSGLDIRLILMIRLGIHPSSR